MKKTFYLISVLFLVNCNQVSNDNDLISLDLNGNVKSMAEFSYPKLSTNWNNKDIEYYFNKNAYTNRKIEYNYNTYTIYKYNESNKISRANQYSLKDSLMYIRKYEYENYKLIKHKAFNLKNEVAYSSVYNYSKSSNGNILITEKEFDSKGDLQRHTSILQNQKKQDISYSEYNLKGELTATGNSKYNDNGKIVEHTKKDVENNLKWKINKTYNSKNLEIEKKSYIPKKDKEWIKISKYEFDDNGNWIIRYLIQDNDTLKTIKRKIEYFE